MLSSVWCATLMVAAIMGTCCTTSNGADEKAKDPAPGIKAKTAATIFPTIQFQNASIEEALEFFRVMCRESDPPRPWVNLVLKMSSSRRDQVKITIDVHNMSYDKALRHVAELAGAEVIYTPSAVMIRDKGMPLPPAPDPAKSDAAKQAAQLIFPHVDFEGATIEECLEFFRIKGQDIDPAKASVKIVLQPGLDPKKTVASLSLRNISLLDALYYMADQVDLELVAEPQQLVLKTPTKQATSK